MQHIVIRHHAYVRKELPLIEGLIAAVRETRGRADANMLVPLEKVFRFFKREVENHLRREEEVLFPLIRQVETASKSGGKPPQFSFGHLANPVGIMEERPRCGTAADAKNAGVHRQLHRSGGKRECIPFAF